MSQRLTITMSDDYFVKLLAICRAEHRRPASMVRLMMEEAIRSGLSPTQKLLFDIERGPDGKPALKLLHGGKSQ